MPSMKFDLDGLDNLISDLGKQGEGFIKMGLYDGSHIAYEEAQRNIEKMQNISDVDRKGLLSSMYHSKMYNEDGTIYETISFTGYNDRGAPNIVVARSIESGRSNTQKHPFMRPAANRTKKQVIQKMQSVISNEVKKIQKG